MMLLMEFRNGERRRGAQNTPGMSLRGTSLTYCSQTSPYLRVA
jgi:hypothetical protein